MLRMDNRRRPTSSLALRVSIKLNVITKLTLDNSYFQAFRFLFPDKSVLLALNVHFSQWDSPFYNESLYRAWIPDSLMEKVPISLLGSFGRVTDPGYREILIRPTDSA